MLDIEEGELLSSDEEVEVEDKCNSLNIINEAKKEPDHGNNYNKNVFPSKIYKRKYDDVFQNNENPNKKQHSENAVKEKKKYLCKYYANGECKNRSTCTYMHQDFPCKFFHDAETICNLGENCRYSHAPISNDLKSIFEAFKAPQFKEVNPDRHRCLLENPPDIPNSLVNLPQSGINKHFVYNHSTHTRLKEPIKSRFSDIVPFTTVNKRTNNSYKPSIYPLHISTKPGQPIIRPDITQPPPNSLNHNVVNLSQNNIPRIDNKQANTKYVPHIIYSDKTYEQKQLTDKQPVVDEKDISSPKPMSMEWITFDTSFLQKHTSVDYATWSLIPLDNSRPKTYYNLIKKRLGYSHKDPRLKLDPYEIDYDKIQPIVFHTYAGLMNEPINEEEYDIKYNLFGEKLLAPKTKPKS